MNRTRLVAAAAAELDRLAIDFAPFVPQHDGRRLAVAIETCDDDVDHRRILLRHGRLALRRDATARRAARTELPIGTTKIGTFASCVAISCGAGRIRVVVPAVGQHERQPRRLASAGGRQLLEARPKDSWPRPYRQARPTTRRPLVAPLTPRRLSRRTTSAGIAIASARPNPRSAATGVTARSNENRSTRRSSSSRFAKLASNASSVRAAFSRRDIASVFAVLFAALRRFILEQIGGQHESPAAGARRFFRTSCSCLAAARSSLHMVRLRRAPYDSRKRLGHRTFDQRRDPRRAFAKRHPASSSRLDKPVGMVRRPLDGRRQSMLPARPQLLGRTVLVHQYRVKPLAVRDAPPRATPNRSQSTTRRSGSDSRRSPKPTAPIRPASGGSTTSMLSLPSAKIAIDWLVVVRSILLRRPGQHPQRTAKRRHTQHPETRPPNRGRRPPARATTTKRPRARTRSNIASAVGPLIRPSQASCSTICERFGIH